MLWCIFKYMCMLHIYIYIYIYTYICIHTHMCASKFFMTKSQALCRSPAALFRSSSVYIYIYIYTYVYIYIYISYHHIFYDTIVYYHRRVELVQVAAARVRVRGLGAVREVAAHVCLFVVVWCLVFVVRRLLVVVLLLLMLFLSCRGSSRTRPQPGRSRPSRSGTGPRCPARRRSLGGTTCLTPLI